jgi:predicted nucleic acid-binding protein
MLDQDRVSNLDVTGSIGILIKAKSAGYPVAMSDALNRMRERGIWLSKDVISFALAH